MKDCFLRAMMVVAIIPVIAAAQHNTPLAGDGHPDLNGTWVDSGGLARRLTMRESGKQGGF